MNFRYDDTEDCQQQLDSSTVMTDRGYAVFLNYYDKWMWQITDMSTGKREVLDIRKAGISFAPLELGYVNHHYGLVYLTRKPKRMWKQGISYDNLTTLRGVIEDGLLNSKPLNDCLMNNYPTLQECYDEAIKEAVSWAFNRNFALDTRDYPNIRLEYKGTHVGDINDKLQFEVFEKYHYIKETLEEIINAKS